MIYFELKIFFEYLFVYSYEDIDCSLRSSHLVS